MQGLAAEKVTAAAFGIETNNFFLAESYSSCSSSKQYTLLLVCQLPAKFFLDKP